MVVVVVIDVIRKECGIVLGGIPYMLVYGILICVPVSLIWRKRGISSTKEGKNEECEGVSTNVIANVIIAISLAVLFGLFCLIVYSLVNGN